MQKPAATPKPLVRSGTMLSVVRRLVVILGLIATVGLLAACGKSRHLATATTAHSATTTSAHARPPSSTPTGAAKPLTRTQAIAFARAINLTAADVPGFRATSKREHKHETAAEKQLALRLLRCAGGSSSSRDGLAKVSSKDFKLDHDVLHLSVNSEVSVARTPSLVTKELRGIHNNHVRGCLSHYFSLLLKHEILKEQKYRSTIGPISVSVSQGTPPAPGATGSFWWRIAATITVRNIKLPFYIDILGFAYGPAEVSLFSSGALKPFPAAAQEYLYRLLLKRTEAHSV